MVSEEKKLINAIQPKKFDGMAFKSDESSFVVPNLSGIKGNKDAMNKLTLQTVTDNGATTTNDIVINTNLQSSTFDANTYGWKTNNSKHFRIDTANTYQIFSANNLVAKYTYSTGGQLVINGSIVDGCACLEVRSTTRGLLFPRMTTAQKNAIGSPVAGLVVYDTDLNKLCVRTAAAWETITSA